MFGSLVGGVANDDSVNQANLDAVLDYDDSFSFDVDSRLAVQGGAHYDNISLIGQLAVSGNNDFEPDFEWLYLGFTPVSGLTVRVGRLLLPVYHYSDHRQIGYTYPWVRLPIGIYSPYSASVDAIDGGSIFYEMSLHQWEFTFESYYGSIEDEFNFDFATSTSGDGSFTIDDSVGLVASASNSITSIRLGYHRSGSVTTQADTPEYLALLSALRVAGFSGVADAIDAEDTSIEHISISAHTDYNSWIAGAEYTLVPADKSLFIGRESWYGMVGKRLADWTIYASYAEDNRDPENGQSAPIRQQAEALLNLDPSNIAIPQLLGLAAGVDLAADAFSIEHSRYSVGLRYDFDSPVSVKAQYQHVKDNRNDLSDDLVLLSLDFILF